MVACYPANKARYTKHYDNDGKHPQLKQRVLTTLVYLNSDWKEGDGGELCVYEASDTERLRARVPPTGGRLLMFFSDTRVPHEVLPAHVHRYSVTSWYLNSNTKR